MRLATFNLENLFSRPKVMNLDTWEDGREILDDVDALNSLIARDPYSTADKRAIKRILDKYEFGARNKRQRPFRINEVRERLYKVPRGSRRVEVVASGRQSWVGWVELTREELDPRAVGFTGKVIDEVAADVMAVVEVEDRITLQRFNDQVLGTSELDCSYPFNLCIDGNDPRGIDVGILSRMPIISVRSHIKDVDDEGQIFSRDCAEYEIDCGGANSLWVLVNHFKSKGHGGFAASSRRRERQARRVAEIYRAARQRSDYVAVVGDLNDVPESKALASLVVNTDLRDVSEYRHWVGPRGTFGTGRGKSSKIDYILLSPELWGNVRAAGIERRGIYAPTLEIMWPGITKTTAASDHGALWVDLAI